MNLINELRMLAEDLYVNGYNRYSAAMSKAADELAKWEAVFGHLGDTPDECGNAIIAARDELEERCATLTDAQPAPSVSDGWKEAAIAWEVCGSLHREYAKGKDPFFKKRQEDFVKHANDARTMLAAPEAKPASSFADTYQGAMEEVAIWKKRALEAEDLNRKFVAEINGPTYMGEPEHSKPDCGEAGHDEGCCGNRQCLPGAKGEEK